MPKNTVSIYPLLEQKRKLEISTIIDPKTQRVFSNLVQHRPCPVCNAENFAHCFVKEGFDHGECRECGMFYVVNVLKDAVLHTVYNSAHHTEGWKVRASNPGTLEYKRNYFKKKARLIEKFSSPGSVLDVGCGAGDFLNIMKQQGWEVHGLEFNTYARTFVTAQYGIAVENKQLRELPSEKYDVIAMHALLEHLPDPKKMLTEAHRVLKKGGTLFLSFPYRYGLSIVLLQNYAPIFKGREHFNFFSKNTITKLLHDLSFDVAYLTTDRQDLYSIVTRLPKRMLRKNEFVPTKPINSENTFSHTSGKMRLRSFLFYKVLAPCSTFFAKLCGVGDYLVIIAKKK